MPGLARRAGATARAAEAAARAAAAREAAATAAAAEAGRAAAGGAERGLREHEQHDGREQGAQASHAAIPTLKRLSVNNHYMDMDVLEGALWGFVGGFALILGAVIALVHEMSRAAVGCILAFGAGVLISALTFDLTEEAFEAGGTAPTAAGPPARRRRVRGAATR